VFARLRPGEISALLMARWGVSIASHARTIAAPKELDEMSFIQRNAAVATRIIVNEPYTQET
jgi:hypothetical protein